VLFGGTTNGMPGTPFGDTWEWNGTDWTQRTPTAAPQARFGHTMAHGPQGTTVLFSGVNSCMGLVGDLWQWNGTNWNQQSPALSPPGRICGAMAYDAAQNATLLFGGGIYSVSGVTCLNDTWELRGPSSMLVQQPVSITAVIGLPAVFGVTAYGATGYQWRKGGTPIQGADKACYLIPSVGTADAGSYDVVVANGDCYQTSSAATLTVHARADLNDDGHVSCPDVELLRSAWTGPGTPPAPCTTPGDTDCNGHVDFGDINPFVLALQGEAAYHAVYPDCDWYNADCDSNGHVDFGDINPFVALLVGG
jgi:hypothetical protein